jgi:hypothetical protein
VATSAVSPGTSRLEVLDNRAAGAGLLLHNVRRDLHRLVVLLLRHLNLQLLHFPEVAGVGLRDRGDWGAWLIGPAVCRRDRSARDAWLAGAECRRRVRVRNARTESHDGQPVHRRSIISSRTGIQLLLPPCSRFRLPPELARVPSVSNVEVAFVQAIPLAAREGQHQVATWTGRKRVSVYHGVVSCNRHSWTTTLVCNRHSRAVDGRLDVDVKIPNWADVTTAITTVLLALAALIALAQIVLMRRAGLAESATEAARRWSEPSFQRASAKIQAYLKKGGPENLKVEVMKLLDENSPEYYELLTIPDYFEDLAILIKYRAITFRIVDDAYGLTALAYWRDCQPLVVALREKDQRVYNNFQILGNRIASKRESVKS